MPKLLTSPTFNILILLVLSFLLTNCEREITLDLPEPDTKIVVEGAIETDQPPFVTINTNFPYFGTFTLADYQANFVHNAKVTVSDGSTSVDLVEICWSTLSPIEKQLLASSLGGGIFDSIPADFDYCVYTVSDPLNPAIVGKINHTYNLEILTEGGQKLSANTRLYPPISLDSIWLENHNSPEFSDYYRVYARLNDPDTIGNFYRIFTQYNDQAPTPPLRSVFDDVLINGIDFFFPIDRGQARSDTLDIDTYGYFKKGDQVTIKWCTIDPESFQFWNSLEYAANSNGPLSSQSQIISNITGGIGIWIAYGASYQSIKVE